MRAIVRTLYHLGVEVVWKVVWPLLVLKVRKFGSAVSITCDREDGGGAQLHGRISSLAFARAAGIQFFHTPMTRVHFAKDERDIAKWNGVIRFEQISASISPSINVQEVKCLRDLIVRLLLRSEDELPICYKIAHCHGYTDRFPESISQLIPELKLNFGPTISSHRQECSESVIHVRGEIGGVEKDSPRRSSPDMIGSKILHGRKNSLSQGVLIFTSEFSTELSNFETDLVHIDYSTEVFEVLNCMIRAKNLYMAKSSLSYVAGILSSGVVYYESFWHPMLDHWLPFPK